MAKDDQTADLFEADGVTPKAKDKPAITPELLDAEKRAAAAEGEAKGLEKALKAAPKTEKPAPKTEKVWTRAELRAQVTEGNITEDQMFETLERQLTKSLTKTITENVRAEVAIVQTGNKIDDQIMAYVGVFPDINKDGSPTRAKIQAAFDELVSLGDNPGANSTELKAIKMALGPLKPNAGRKPAPDSHEEVGGGGNDSDRPGNDGWAKGLSPKMTKHYQKLIDRGIYKSHSDPKLVAELKLARARPN